MNASSPAPSGTRSRGRKTLSGFVWLFWRPVIRLVKLAAAGARKLARPTRWSLRKTWLAIRPLLNPLWWYRLARGILRRVQLRSVPLRRWLLLALAAIIFLPILAGTITAVLIDSTGPPSNSRARATLGAGLTSWTDPEWQLETRDVLEERGIEFLLIIDGREVYRTSANPLPADDFPGSVRQYDYEQGGSKYTALVYGDHWDPFVENDNDWMVPIVAISTLVLTFVGMAIFFGRSVVRPLGATSAAAGDVAGGNLRISLPGSRVREVAELNAAFEGMASALAKSLTHEAALEEQRRLFVGAVAHDLRTPLFALRGSLEAIQTGVADSPEKQEKYLAVAQDKAEALDRLVSDLFDFTRLEYLDQTPIRERLEIGELVGRTVEALESRAQQKGVDLKYEDRSHGAIVNGDPHLLTRAFDNLIDNAIRFTPARGIATVECFRDPQGIVISVADNGPGIEVEDLPHLFEALYRGESSRNRRTGGTGLGLTIARNALLAHGGDLVARNRTPSGALFVATLPVEPVEGPPATSP